MLPSASQVPGDWRRFATIALDATSSIARRAAVAVVAAAVALAPSVSRAGSLRVSLQGLDCPNRAQIADGLQQSLKATMESQPDLSLAVESPGPALLRVRLEGPWASVDRVVPFRTSECGEIGETLALLTRSWLHRRWSEPPPGVDPLARAPVLAEPDEERVPKVLERHPIRLRFGAGLGAGGFTGRGPARLAGSASGEWDATDRWGALLQIWTQAPLETRFPPGRIAVGLWEFAALGRASLAPSSSTSLDLLAGPALRALPVRSSGFTRRLDTTILDFAAVLAVRARARVAGPVALFVDLQTGLSLRQHTLKVDPLGDAASLPRSTVGAGAGLIVTWQ